MIQDVFGWPVEMEQPQDFSFALRYGAPFGVWARPETGLLFFGLDSARYGRLCLRYAGAPLAGAKPDQAVSRLRAAMPAYEALYPHPALAKLQGHGEAAGGYAALFRWVEGEGLDGRDALRRLLAQPLLSRLRMIDPLMDFHAFAAAQGWLSVGFCLSSLVADLSTATVTIADVDLYRRLPAVNDRGRMPGAVRFLSPEEYEQGAALDELTMQYTLGALAFAFFAPEGSRERADWVAGEALYRVAIRACSDDRSARFPSLAAFLEAWREAARKTIR
ncbi:MAG: hypothetical protein IJS53_04535 [Clostridia bacterium]|nr:hypothetical protein [Clostridia bacterium]